MVSDDTEHACFVAQSLVDAGTDANRFTVEFARRLKWWLSGVPAGVGLAREFLLEASRLAAAGAKIGRGGSVMGWYSGVAPKPAGPRIGVDVANKRNALSGLVGPGEAMDRIADTGW